MNQKCSLLVVALFMACLWSIIDKPQLFGQAQLVVRDRNVTFVCLYGSTLDLAAPSDFNITNATYYTNASDNAQSLMRCTRSGSVAQGSPNGKQCPADFYCMTNWWAWIEKMPAGEGFCCGSLTLFLNIGK